MLVARTEKAVLGVVVDGVLSVQVGAAKSSAVGVELLEVVVNLTAERMIRIEEEGHTNSISRPAEAGPDDVPPCCDLTGGTPRTGRESTAVWRDLGADKLFGMRQAGFHQSKGVPDVWRTA